MEEWWKEGGDQGPEMGEKKEGSTRHQSAVNLQNNRKTNNSTQIILGLISPLVITFSLLVMLHLHLYLHRVRCGHCVQMHLARRMVVLQRMSHRQHRYHILL